MRERAQGITSDPNYQAGAQMGEMGAERALNMFEGRLERYGAMGSMVERVAGIVISLAVVTLVLNQLFTLSIIQNTSGPFSGLIDSVENIGSAALTLLVLGALAAAAGVVLRMFRGGF